MNVERDGGIPLWIDADPSGLVWTGLDCDDDLAILAGLALHRRGVVNLQGLSVCGGNAPLSHVWPDVRLLLDHAGASAALDGVVPLKGCGWRSMQVAVAPLRHYHYLVPDEEDSGDASAALVRRSRAGAEAPIHILALGPATNVARAINEGLDLSGVAHVYLMGGELTGGALDLNFRSDRAAARTVVDADVPKTLITVQTCGQVAVSESHLDTLDCPGAAACALLPKMRMQVRWMPRLVNRAVRARLRSGDGRWRASPSLDRGFVPWDVVALLSVAIPDAFDGWEHHRVEFPRCAGEREPCDGTMRIVEDLGGRFDGGNWSGVVRTPRAVRNETRLLELMFDLLGEVPAATPRPPLFWGFCNDLLGVVLASIVFFWGLSRRRLR